MKGRIFAAVELRLRKGSIMRSNVRVATIRGSAISAVLTLLVLLVFVSPTLTSNILEDSRSASSQQVKTLPVTVLPMSGGNGQHEAELACDDVQLSTPNSIQKLSCVLKNRSAKSITAGTLAITINLEVHGKIEAVTAYDTFDSFLHPDFRSQHALNQIRPGESYRMDLGPAAYDGKVVSIAATIDYVEFLDGSTTDSQTNGARIVSNLREGAAKYKRWLAQKFAEKKKSVDAIVPLLYDRENLPPEFLLLNSDQQQGARLYRDHSRRSYEQRGRAVLTEELNRAP
jgi:hypothetical protein